MNLIGLIGSLFFVVYAFGQLINGYLGDKLSPKKFIIFALIGTLLANLFIGLTNNLAVIIICWSINGYFQSIFWGPLIRILSGHFSHGERRNVSSGMSTTMVFGYALAWTVLGRVVLFASWRWLFLIPSMIAFVLFVVWMTSVKSEQQNKMIPQKRRSVSQSIKFLSENRLWLLIAACCFMGIIKEGISLWAPMLFSEAVGLGLSDSLSALLIIPLANFCGILISNRLHKHIGGENDLKPVFVMICMILLCCTLLSLKIGLSKPTMILLLATISAMSYGCNTIFLALIPLKFASENMVSSLVGILDFSTYVGAALSSILTGVLVSEAGWGKLPLMWLVAGGVSVFLVGFQIRKHSAKTGVV